jgi:predicted peroxiredoxin
MAKLLYFGTHASDDPTKAALVFVSANGATEAGHEPIITLVGEGVSLMKDAVAASTVGVGWPSVKDLMAITIANGVPINI